MAEYLIIQQQSGFGIASEQNIMFDAPTDEAACNRLTQEQKRVCDLNDGITRALRAQEQRRVDEYCNDANRVHFSYYSIKGLFKIDRTTTPATMICVV